MDQRSQLLASRRNGPRPVHHLQTKGSITMSNEKMRQRLEKHEAINDLADKYFDEAIKRGEPFTEGLSNWAMDKGDVISIARIAGIMAAKQTSTLIPLCHPLPLDQVTLDIKINEIDNRVDLTATSKTTAKTGVEMESLTAVSIAALTIYDMCKSVDKGMRIDGIRLVRKTGGKSGDILLE